MMLDCWVLLRDQCHFLAFTPPKTNMTMKDVSPIKNGDFPFSYVSSCRVGRACWLISMTRSPTQNGSREAKVVTKGEG